VTTSPVDTLTVQDISWTRAMENAVRVLVRGDEYSNRKIQQYEYISANAALAQAWVAVAREITMHARAAQ
jgi:hypothetical protein